MYDEPLVAPTTTPGTPTPTDQPNVLFRAFADTHTVGIAMVGISGVGILLVLIFGFFKKSK